MPSTTPGIIALDGQEYVIVDDTYLKQLQTPFNPRFSTGEANLGDLSFFQYMAMEDWSGGNGQEIFDISNKFMESEGIDVTTQKEFKLTPKVELLAHVNGPQAEQVGRPIEQEDAWPQVIEWLGKAVIFNDRIDYDSGGTEFLEVYDTDVLIDKVIGHDSSGTNGVTVNAPRCTILNVSDHPYGLPGDVVKVRVKFNRPKMTVRKDPFLWIGPSNFTPPFRDSKVFRITYFLHFGGDAARQSSFKSSITKEYANAMFTFSNYTSPYESSGIKEDYAELQYEEEIEFLVTVPSNSPGIYKLWASCSWENAPIIATTGIGPITLPTKPYDFFGTIPSANTAADASNILFLIQTITGVQVTRKNLYAPQMKAATVIGSKLVGSRTYGGKSYIEVYEEQNGAVDRTLQIGLAEAGATPVLPTYVEMTGSNDLVIVALDNRIYKVDILTVGLTDSQRMTYIGAVPGDYVSGMTLWNQRIYIGSFNKNEFTSTISWTDGTQIMGSYAIDGKFWITDLATFNGALFYSGGTQDKIGHIRAYPSEELMSFEHPTFDSRVRTLNAGRFLYAGWSHGTGLAVITPDGISTWAKINLGDNNTNVVWDIEEVGDTVYYLANSGFLKTTNKFDSFGYLETSKIGGNTPLINKEWVSVDIEYEGLLAAHSIRVYARNSSFENNQWTELYTVTEVGTTGMTIFFPSGFSSQWAQLRIELTSTDPYSTPIIKKILIKYVPSSLDKLQWSFTIRADSNLKLLNGRTNGGSGSDILNSVFDLRTKGIVTFRDADEEEYRVIVSDIRQTSPVINKEKLEGMVSVELLEI